MKLIRVSTISIKKAKQMRLILSILLAFQAGAAHAITVGFNDGFADLSSARYAYTSLGFELPNMRFFNSSAGGRIPIFYGSDDWGVLGTDSIAVAQINFLSPVDYVEIDARGQADFSLAGLEPFAATIHAFNSLGIEVASQTITWGRDLIVPEGTYGNSFGGSGYPLGDIYLRVEAQGAISSVSMDWGRKGGIDTLRFGTVAAIPEPASLVLLALGLVGLSAARSRKPGKNEVQV